MIRRMGLWESEALFPSIRRPTVVSVSFICSQRAYIDQLRVNSYDYKENDQTLSANFKIPYNFLSTFLSGFLKFGGKYRYYHRVNDENAPYLHCDIKETTSFLC